MPDVYTGTSALAFDQTAWNKTAYKALRPQLFFDRFATVKASTFHPGTTVSFNLWTEMSAATTPLSEAVDVEAVALDDSTVSVTLQEYGNAVIPTAKVRATSFIDVDPDVANLVGFNAGLSLDTIVRDVAVTGTHIRYATGGSTDPTSVATTEASDTISSADIRYVRAKLVGANVAGVAGQDYAGVIHPDVSYDLRSETGATNTWSDPVAYSDPTRRWNGEVGKYEGIRFMESSRAPVYADTGSPSTVDAYYTLIFGSEAIAKAWSNGGGYNGGADATITIAEKADNLNRFKAVGWKWLGGYAIFRDDAIWRIVSGSSIGTNA